MTSQVDEALLGERSRRLPLLVALVVLIVAGGLGFLAYRIWFSGGGEGESELITETVARTTIRASIAASGSVEPVEQVALRFPASGRVQETLVELGQQVKKGDPLVRLEDDALSNRLETAQANLTSAQIRLDIILKGASLADLATAEQAVVSAQVALNRAGRDLEDVRNGPTATDLAAAEQAVAGAKATLASAQATLEQLTADASDAEVAAAESSVAAAEQSLAGAEIALENALSTVDAAEAALRAAGATYCAGEATEYVPSWCPSVEMPLSATSVDALLARLDDPGVHVVPTPSDGTASTTTIGMLIQSLMRANADFVAAANAVETAGESVTAAEAALKAAEEKLNAVREGAADEDIDAAEAAVVSAEEALRSAELKLDDLRGGAEPADIAEAEDNVRQAQAALNAAVASRDDILAGADPEDVELQRQQVRLALLSVDAARHDLDEAALASPFDGTVAAISVQPGDLVGPSVDVLTLLTPDAMEVKLSVGETDLPSVGVGTTGVIIFDAIQGRPFPLVVRAIDLAPRVEQGVVTYTAVATLLGLDGEGPKPAPSMNGAAILITEQRTDVLAVPNRAIRRRGEDVVLDVLVDGVAETRVVKTGLADSEMTEVTEGIEEGELVVVGTGPASGSPSSEEEPEPLPEGIR